MPYICISLWLKYFHEKFSKKFGQVRSAYLCFQGRNYCSDIIVERSSITLSENIVLKFILKEVRTSVKIFTLTLI